MKYIGKPLNVHYLLLILRRTRNNLIISNIETLYTVYIKKSRPWKSSEYKLYDNILLQFSLGPLVVFKFSTPSVSLGSLNN